MTTRRRIHLHPRHDWSREGLHSYARPVTMRRADDASWLSVLAVALVGACFLAAYVFLA